MALPNSTDIYDLDQNCSVNCSDDNSADWSRNACSLLMCTCCIVGIFGNIISFVIFTHRSMRSPINILLAGLSIVDLCLVILAIPVFVVPGLMSMYFYYHPSSITANTTKYYETKLVSGLYQLNMMAQSCSVWTCCVINCERFVAVVYPFFAQRYSTVYRAKGAQMTVFILAIVYNVVRFFEYRQKDNGDMDRTLRDNPIYFYFYYTSLYLITHFFVPFFFITVTNVLILRELRRAYSIRQLMMGSTAYSDSLLSQNVNDNGQEKRSVSAAAAKNQRQTSHVIVVVTVMFTVCNSLLFLVTMWEAIDVNLFGDSNPWANTAFLILDMSNVLIVFNSACTFVVYLVYCTKYRRLFLRLCAVALGKVSKKGRTADDRTLTTDIGTKTTLVVDVPNRQNKVKTSSVIVDPRNGVEMKRVKFSKRTISLQPPESGSTLSRC